MRQIQDIKAIDFSKEDGLVPAIIQDNNTGKVLMLGYMNEAALEQTLDTGKVTFFSRSKQRLWTKGETSENFLNLVSISPDCDQDALLVKVNPEGPTCHLGDDTCWEESNENSLQFLGHLTEVIKDRRQKSPEESYVARLFSKGINKVAQKVGEEAVEVVIEAKDSDDNLFLNESADLLFHYMMLLEAKGFTLNDVISILKERHK
ncbi:bifunctional phosphoribosyl-AMP cyclohydrolase/phosphoribosyl-ATP diphosphatase HisIE [uncultured Roseivirga sp.]|uniref:bifunctional phosphoribosyl-AMP cyclohydrolase/phosphoribosyl-ATP diphosphatase HisIE n=1 Tax=uncultured Roseivirga sp. TaxID=543088 RepID=UPI000D7B5EA8|nr:bifunctional phosphoribosyl-AMP cyclohydrolase/phosphoribosyl-ATP diphosphatase HisIE [uncultured Roseivirga sp.]PWL32201.1 MAG: bifunctional phosphoribosyl-AMP cyclohydrolase/phosphoribosyl-ATP diphosphatase [Roseivirga sp. XM-24bin3]